jgi:hypothetical protein
MRRAPLAACLLGLALLGACEESSGDPSPHPSTGGAAGQHGIQGGEAGAGARAACLERPGELPRPPRAGLPCELFPPGYSR